MDHNRIRQDRVFRGRFERGSSLETVFSLSLQSLYVGNLAEKDPGLVVVNFKPLLSLGTNDLDRIECVDFAARILLRVGFSQSQETTDNLALCGRYGIR